MRGGGREEDEEASRKLMSMDVETLEKGGGGADPPRPAVKYHGWRAMPFIIGTYVRRSDCSVWLGWNGCWPADREINDPSMDGSFTICCCLLVQGTRRSRSWARWARRRTCWCT
jgi:hypothetical protein